MQNNPTFTNDKNDRKSVSSYVLDIPNYSGQKTPQDITDCSIISQEFIDDDSVVQQTPLNQTRAKEKPVSEDSKAREPNRMIETLANANQFPKACTAQSQQHRTITELSERQEISQPTEARQNTRGQQEEDSQYRAPQQISDSVQVNGQPFSDLQQSCKVNRILNIVNNKEVKQQ